MAADALTEAVSQRICNHMNKDHANAVVLYAQVYGQTQAATAAEMSSIDPHGMDLIAQVDGSSVAVRVEFDHPLQDSEDAHHTLIDMLKQARAQAH